MGEPSGNWPLFRQIRDQFYAVHLAAAAERVGNPLSGGPAAERGLLLRDSIVFRLESACFHIDLIRRSQQALESAVHPLERDAIDFVRTASRDQKFLLDDIVFALVSVFDYFGSWCDHVYNCELTSLRGFRLLRVSARPRSPETEDCEPANNTLRETDIVTQADEENRAWLKHLSAYRGALAHGRADPAGGYYRHSFTAAGPGTAGSMTTDVRITAPDPLLEKVRILGDLGDEPTILAVSERLNQEAIDGLRRMLFAVSRDLDLGEDPNVARYLGSI